MRNPLTQFGKWLSERGEPPRSDKWPAARRAWLAQHPTCAACGSAKDLQVHHKRPFHLYPELELNPANFITLCETIGTDHHLHVGHLGDWKDYNERVDADAAAELEHSSKKG